jgi:putative dimethyl sulfoxide reductase chaperone
MTKHTRELNGRQRGEAYWFLSDLFANQLDEESVKRMASVASNNGEEAGLAGEISKAFIDIRDIDVLTLKLAQEHTRLFGGISEEYGPPPPYESLWREGVLMGESTVQVARCYLEAGYEPDGRFAPLDHLVEELRFMASLSNAEYEALHSGNEELATQLIEKQRHFLSKHLGTWISQYSQKIAALSAEKLYRSLATVTATVIAQDAEELAEMVQ